MDNNEWLEAILSIIQLTGIVAIICIIISIFI
jgi:hypothetical protein